MKNHDLIPPESSTEQKGDDDSGAIKIELPALQVSGIRYFAITVFLWGLIAVMLVHSPQAPGYSLLEIIVFVFGFLFVIIPMLASEVNASRSLWQAGCRLFKAKEKRCETIRFFEFWSQTQYLVQWFLVQWYLPMFLPSETIRKQYRWLTPVYCISIAAFIVVAIYTTSKLTAPPVLNPFQ